MRSDFTPQVETREIDDTDLDGVAGGIGLAGGVRLGGGIGVTGLSDTLGAVGSAVPVGGLLNTATGLTGLTAPVNSLTGIVSGL
ncbi:hypothetical protein [Streptacidiphilus rugosus]|uniref:hypothetical protein n=1 Tax=Streptacidiphilus rugosus TaxID=405783 RepID=UPI00055F501D|nr:hypothetical protein [Streptacidiphilus rugosus]